MRLSTETPIWFHCSLRDDLPHAPGMGDFARVKRWFDAPGLPALGDPHDHYPPRFARSPGPLVATAQQILDVALGWACMNRQLEIAVFLLEHGADINTRWSTHEPASILHECAIHNNFEAARFLIDHGIDMTVEGYRWKTTAESWGVQCTKRRDGRFWLRRSGSGKVRNDWSEEAGHLIC